MEIEGEAATESARPPVDGFCSAGRKHGVRKRRRPLVLQDSGSRDCVEVQAVVV